MPGVSPAPCPSPPVGYRYQEVALNPGEREYFPQGTAQGSTATRWPLWRAPI